MNSIKPAEAIEFEINVPELSQLGDRPSSGYNGRLFTWVGQVETRTDSSIFRNLEELIKETGQFKNRLPGFLQFRIYANSVLKIAYQPISFELLIERYKQIPDNIKESEKEKWQLIKIFQLAWAIYEAGGYTFKEFYKEINWGRLVFPTGITVFAHVMKEKPAEFEKLLLGLYNETKNLKERIKEYKEGFADLYYSLPDHGKNTFQEERTIATLLAFRYPEKYTLFKDSFYSKLSKGLGIKPYPTGEKIFHYYSMVDDFVKKSLSQHPELIAEKNNRLDDLCYKDQNNLVLVQDILYLTLDAKESSHEEEEQAEFIAENQIRIKKPNMENSLNSILYGPPGTGKTYNTINKAVAIANSEFDIASATRDQLRTEYERLVKDGQIEFITFHQSLSYEDFIEGIKPVEPKEGDPFLKYQVMDGIFKRLAERASKVPDSKPAGFSIADEDFQKAGFYKISLGDTSNPDDDNIYEWCIKNEYIALGWGDAINFTGLKENDIQQMVPAQLEKFAAQAVNYFIHYIKPGDYVVVTYGNLQFRAIGKVTGAYEFKNVDGLNVHQFRKVEWLLTGAELPYEEVYNKQFSQQSIYRLDKREIKKDFFVKAGNALPVNNKPKNYVLIIDEINRGNVSQIFGELITLIEEDKRAGKNEALTVVLPYSKKSFSVPSNLYIVGTMNTADRSVEALDTALRRRFVFEEMMPKPELLSPQAMIWKLWWDYEKVGWGDKDYIAIEGALYDLLGVPEDFNDDDDKEVIWNKMKAEGPKESQIHLFDDLEFDGLNFQLLLEKINQRIEKILGKDQQIGHSFFINVISIEDLYSAIYQKLIPQLQEYFYGDFGKIGLILGRDFISYNSAAVQFADFKYEDADLLLERKIYQINTFKIERGIDLDAFAEAVLKIYTPNNI